MLNVNYLCMLYPMVLSIFSLLASLISMKKNNASQIVIKSVESILVIGYILFEELIWNTFAKPIYLYF